MKKLIAGALLAGVAAAVLVASLAVWLFPSRFGRVVPPPPPAVEPVHAPAEPTGEVKAFEGLRRLARPTVDLVAWSRDGDARDDDCVLMLPPPRDGDRVTLRPGAGCDVIAINGRPVGADVVAAPVAFPPFRPGLNWVRVRTSLPRAVRGSAEVPADRESGEIQGDTPDEEWRAYEKLRYVLYPPVGEAGKEHLAALRVLETLPPGPDGLVRTFGRAWIEAAHGLHELGHGTEMVAVDAVGGSKLWDRPEVRRVAREYLDAIESLLIAHPRREYLWLGLAWQMRWGECWDAARAGFTHAAGLAPRAGWVWYETARWEADLVSFPSPRDPRTRSAVERDQLEHFRLSRRYLENHDEMGLKEVRTYVDNAIRVLGRRAQK